MATPSEKTVAALTGEKPKRVPRAFPANWRELEEHTNNRHRVRAPESVELSDLEDPAIWGNIAQDLKAYDRVTVVSEDRKFWADVLVIDADMTRARIVVLNTLAPVPPLLSNDPRALPQGFEYRREGPDARWFLYRLADGKNLYQDGFNDFESLRAYCLGQAALRK